jgi:hypothetical protein
MRKSAKATSMTPFPALLAITDSYGNRVGLLASLRGLEPAAFTRAIVVSFEGSKIQVIGREDFVAMKLFAGGPQDTADVRAAILLAGESLDLSLVGKLTQRFGRDATAALKKLLEETRTAT